MNPLWAALGIDPASHSLLILGVGLDRDEVGQNGRDRAGEQGIAGKYSMTVVGLHQAPGILKDQVKCWLAAHDLVGATADQLVRDLFREIADMLDLMAAEIGEATL